MAAAHGGAGSPRARKDGTDPAAARALAVLKAGGSALDAALAGVVVLEDDPRFNAGTGGGCNDSPEKKAYATDYRNQMAWSVAE